MQRRHWAWIFIPVAIIVLAVAGWLVSSFQKEAGIVAPGKAGVAAVAAAAEAAAAASGTGLTGYEEFSDSLRVALIETENMPVTNPAETRLEATLTNMLDCLSASREAWQIELDQSWVPALHGSATYWHTLHPALAENEGSSLSPAQVREWTGASANYWREKATALVE
jgi:hypothetical protein